MTPDTKSTIPSFQIGSTTFTCWITDNGRSYVWKAHDGQVTAGRNEGSGTYWTQCKGRRVGWAHLTLKAAMVAGVQAYGKRAAA